MPQEFSEDADIARFMEKEKFPGQGVSECEGERVGECKGEDEGESGDANDGENNDCGREGDSEREGGGV